MGVDFSRVVALFFWWNHWQSRQNKNEIEETNGDTCFLAMDAIFMNEKRPW